MVGLAAALALFGGGHAAPVAASQPAPDPIGFTGREWTRLSPEARNAYLSGFLAGAAAQQARASPTPPATGRAVAASAAALKRSGALAFRYRENVYRSHLDDYFFYKNRRRETLIEVLVDMSLANAHGR